MQSIKDNTKAEEQVNRRFRFFCCVIILLGVRDPAAGVLNTGGKSGLQRAGCRRNSGECELRESATEKKTALIGKGEKVR